MFIGMAERAIVGSAAIYAGVTSTFLYLTKAWDRTQIVWTALIYGLDRIRRAVNAVMSVEKVRDRAVGYAA
jgi:hypothetical protein